MQYQSTRAQTSANTVSAAEAIRNGIAPDGGLYMPTEIPHLTAADFISLSSKSYAERAATILSLFLSEYTEEELLADCRQAYSEDRFPGGAAPLSFYPADGISMLELWHGPTCAFKDMALQIMPRLLSRALTKTGEIRTALILVATSGDTGKAALEGYADIPQVKIKVFYPAHGVSRVQKLQMITQRGANVEVCGIEGNFDDAQSGVKRIFADETVREELQKEGVFLSSANSINWGRLVPQIVYYVSAYLDMVAQNRIAMGEMIDICVPTGNFGNIFAAYIAKLMGLPVDRLVCASNSNRILTDFLATGVYDRNRPFFTTISPSMDILISSNLERLLYLVAGPAKTAAYMEKLNATGRYELDADDFQKITSVFCGFDCNEEDTKRTIANVFKTTGTLIDSHTAVGYSAALQHREKGANLEILLASTASPFKFAADVFESITNEKPVDELAALQQLSLLGKQKIPAPLDGIGTREVRFPHVIEVDHMTASVLEFAKTK